ncbi:MAG: divalent metal cation transporter [Pseudonocardia sp.]|nr:divalent metal cation transporter [Pseudonocardia sp.]
MTEYVSVGPARHEPVVDVAAEDHSHRRIWWWLLLVGPGLMVMLADSDAGSVITAAQSGAQYRYQLVACQLALIPILYVVQEITVRLGLVTGRGHGALIRSVFGLPWGLVSAVTLFVACVGALITEFAGLAGVGELIGLPRIASIGAPTLALVGLVLAGRYRRVELVGITIGALELLFIPAAIIARPDPHALLSGLAHPVTFSAPYLTLLAANVGAVIMPWMVFYQQGAVIDKDKRGLGLPRALRAARLDTALGAVATQLVMIAVVVAIAATIGTAQPGASLNTVGDIATGLIPFFGRDAAIWLFGLGMIGASVVAALVVALAGAWGLSEVLGWRHSLNDSPNCAVGFYTLAVVGTLIGAVLVLVWPNLVQLSVEVEVMNACLLPIVLGFLLALERKALPERLRMRGAWRVVTYLLSGLVIVLGLYTIVQTFIGG